MNIALKHGAKVYKPDTYALCACDLEVRSGELLVVMGASGSGKSTLLKVLAGVEPLTAGELYFDGVLAENIAPRERDVSLVFQEYVLYPNKTVYENILTGVKFQDVPYEEAVRRAEEAMALLELTAVRDQRPKALSGGQQQRTALAKALVRRSRLVLMDEPMSNVSEEARSEYCRLIAFMKSQMPGSTFVYVTHNLKEALQLADRIAFMDEGRVVGTVKRHSLDGRIVPEDYTELFEEVFFQNTFRLPCEMEQGKLTVLGNTVDISGSLAARLLRMPERAEVELQTEKLSKTPLLHGIPLVLTVEENGGAWLKMRAGDTCFYLHKRTNLPPGTNIRMYYDVRDLELFDDRGRITAWYSLGGNVFPAKMLGLRCGGSFFVPFDAVKPAVGGEACLIRAERCLQEENVGDYKIAYYAVSSLEMPVAAKLQPEALALAQQKPRLALDLNRAIALG